MFSNLRSLIFKLDPETAHNLAIKSLKFNFIPNILDREKNNPLFETKLFNKKLENPIGMAAGFDKNAEVYNYLFKLGFGFVDVGTVTPLKQYGNPKPSVFRLVEDEALINRLGFNNFGSKNILNRIAYVQSTFNNTIISIADTNGNVISWASAGQKGFKGSRKSTPYAAQIAADSAASKALEYGMKTLSVEVKGPGSGRETALRALQARGFKILSIKDTTPMPHNGTRPPKKRRV